MPIRPRRADHVYDRVISGGRVIDPDTGYDQVANVGIDGARITSISTEPLTGKATIDATNLVVSPGFIDLLSYEPNDYGAWFKIGDGVTTNLGMHGLNNTAKGFFDMYGSAVPAAAGALRRRATTTPTCAPSSR